MEETEEEPTLMRSFLNAPPSKEVFFLHLREWIMSKISTYTHQNNGFMLGL
jgi:hypothetical protein